MIKTLQNLSFNSIYPFLLCILTVNVASQIKLENNSNHLLETSFPSKEFFMFLTGGENNEMVSGQKKSFEIKGGEGQLHFLSLEAGQTVGIDIEKEDFSLKAEVFAPDGKLIPAQIDKKGSNIKVDWLVKTDGTYAIRVSSMELLFPHRYSISYSKNKIDVSSGKDYVEAMNSFKTGEDLFIRQNVEARQAALINYQKALNIWLKLKQYSEAAESSARIGEIHLIFGNGGESLKFFLKAYDLSQISSAPESRLTYLNLIARSAISIGQIETARQSAQKVIHYYRGQDSKRTPNAYANLNLGEILFLSGDLKSALEKFNTVIRISETTGNRSTEFLGYLYRGHAESDLGYLKEARVSYQKSLAIARESFDLQNEGLALTALGGNHSFYGEQESARNCHEKALQLFRQIGDRKNEGVALNGLARYYQELNNLGIAYNYFERSIKLYRTIKNPDFEATTLLSMGQLCFSLDKIPEALKHYRRSFELSKILNKRRIAMLALSFIASSLYEKKNSQTALRELEKNLRFFQAADDRRGQIYFLDSLGDIYFKQKMLPQASENYQKSLSLSTQTGERTLEAEAFYKVALVARTRGQLKEALKNITQALTIIEKLRVQVASEILRVSYFAAVNKYYGFYINLLMQLHSSAPDEGYEKLAWEASEKVKARTLLENISINKVEASGKVPRELLREKRELEQMILSKSNLHTNLLSEKKTLGELERSVQEIGELTIEYEKIQSEIKQNEGRLAIVSSQTAGIADVKSLLQNDIDTCLLEYILTDEKSYLWVITGSEIKSYELPPRQEIEKTATEFYKLLTIDQSQVNGSDEQMSLKIEELSKKAEELSEQLFPFVSGPPAQHRLLIVADGILNYIPFDVLLFPAGNTHQNKFSQVPAESAELSGERRWMINKYEIVDLPSISSLLALRRETGERRRAPEPVIILADPVFKLTDSRFYSENFDEEELSQADKESVFRTGSASKSEVNDLPRLPFTKREGKKILEMLSGQQGLLLTDFDASVNALTDPEIENYQIIHFATHSVVNNEIPELSGIHLSNFKRNKFPVNGLLRLQDIYNLNLNSELVILSSCETSLGKNVKGEGVMSLARGFMFAGTKSVIASLWKVDDEATAELMKYFYEELAQTGISPAEALQIAKLKMAARKKWRHPYFWAGFVLQGEYKNTITFKTSKMPYVIIAGFLLVLVVGVLLVVYRFRKRNRRPVTT